MAKLTGKAKTKFLARINKGRKAKGLKPIRSKTKSSTKTPKKRSKQLKNKPKSATKQRKINKRKSSKNNNNMAKKKRSVSRKSLGMTKVKQGAVGGVVGVATTAIAKRLGANSIADDLGYVTASLAGKGTPGVVGNAVLRQGLGRFGGSLNILNGNGGNGNGNAQNTLGFA